MPGLPSPIRRTLISALRPGNARPRRDAQKIEVAIFKPDRLGDLILASGAIRHLQQQFGPQNCALVVADFTVELAKALFGKSLIIGVPFAHNDLLRGVVPGLWKMRPVLAKYQFENLVCLRHQRSIYEELLLGRIVAERSFGLHNTGESILPADRGSYAFSFTATQAYPAIAPPQICREIEAHSLVLSMIENREVSTDSVLPRLEFPPAAESLNDAVIVSPFATTDIRTYPLSLMVEVLREVQQHRRMRFFLSGAPGDAHRLDQLRELAEAAGVRNVIVRTPASFVDFCSLVAAARGVISVDTSTAHLATALDKPAAIILGGGQYGVFGPWSRSARQIWFTHQVPCFGCSWSCIQPEPLCITQVSPAAVAAGIVERL